MKIKLYTQEQVLDAIEKSEIGYSGSQIIESLTPIELPTFEQIGFKRWEDFEEFNKKGCYPKDYESAYADGFTRGCKWMKEQILNQNK